jgi:hypothetical protein
MHLVYIDESGNTGVNLNDAQQPLFVLAALIVPESCWLELERDLEQALVQLCPALAEIAAEIHATDLRRGSGNASVAFTMENSAQKIFRISERILLLHSGLREIAEAIVSRFQESSETGAFNKKLDRAISETIRELRDNSIRHRFGDDWNYERLCREVEGAEGD